MLRGAPSSAPPSCVPFLRTVPQGWLVAERQETPMPGRHTAYDPLHVSGPLAPERFALWLQQYHRLQALGTLAGDLAHDLNNTLNVIIGYLELIMEELPLDGLALQYLDQIMTAGTRAKDLVAFILKARRLQEHEPSPVALAPVIADVLTALRASCPATFTLQHSVAPEVPPILADATQLYEVVFHLCLNAAHAMRQHGGTLDVRLDLVTLSHALTVRSGFLRPGPYVRLCIQDTGDGIAPDVLPRIFEPFFTTKPPEEGAGLGLTVVESIVRHHDGALDVSSLPGQGSTFTLYFPPAPIVDTAS